jgi:DNA-binding response OmpR family regulator
MRDQASEAESALTVACVSQSDALVARLEALLRAYHTRLTLITPPSQGRAEAAAARFDLVCIDRIGLTDIGREIRRWRHRWPSTQVLLLNASNDAEVRRYLDAGADDVTRVDGCDTEHRLNAAARRARTLNAGLRIAFGDIVCDREARRVWCAGAEIRLTPHEFGVLDCLLWTSPRPAGVSALREFAWNGAATRSTIEVYIGYLRRKLRRSRCVALHTIRGRGYKLVILGDDAVVDNRSDDLRADAIG